MDISLADLIIARQVIQLTPGGSPADAELRSTRQITNLSYTACMSDYRENVETLSLAREVDRLFPDNKDSINADQLRKQPPGE